jgi:hypothetical protein
MRSSTKFALPLAALLFVLLLVPQAALAGSANCPVEPATNVPIASGDVYAGSNCTLNTTGDVDSFVFKANSGDTWQLVAGINGGVYTDPDICLTLFDPNAKQVFSGCSYSLDNQYSVVADQKLTTTGSYTMVISEATDGTINYGMSLERIYPAPPDAQKVKVGQTVAGWVAPLTDQPAFTFAGVTTVTYRASATIPNGVYYDPNLCIAVYFPDGTSAGSGCTYTLDNSYTVQVDFTPPEAGTILVLLSGANAGTVAYDVEASCLVGKCPAAPKPPACTLKDTPSYSSGTLTMYFTVGNKVAATWNAWLTSQSSMTPLSGFPISQPITNPPMTTTQTASLSPQGTVGVLSTLTTPTGGIICSSFVQVNTGTP